MVYVDFVLNLGPCTSRNPPLLYAGESTPSLQNLAQSHRRKCIRVNPKAFGISCSTVSRLNLGFSNSPVLKSHSNIRVF
jgi:hypothetical protein